MISDNGGGYNDLLFHLCELTDVFRRASDLARASCAKWYSARRLFLRRGAGHQSGPVRIFCALAPLSPGPGRLIGVARHHGVRADCFGGISRHVPHLHYHLAWLADGTF